MNYPLSFIMFQLLRRLTMTKHSLIGGYYERRLFVWRLNDGRLLQTVTTDHCVHSVCAAGDVWAVAAMSYGLIVAYSVDGQGRLTKGQVVSNTAG